MSNAQQLSAAPPKGRSGTEVRQRRGVVTFRATEAERAEIEAAAERAGLSVGGYIRSRALAVPVTRAIRRPPVERAALAQILGQLGKCGSNLNQIARVLNSEGETPPAEISSALAEFEAVAELVWQALGNRPRSARP